MPLPDADDVSDEPPRRPSPTTAPSATALLAADPCLDLTDLHTEPPDLDL